MSDDIIPCVGGILSADIAVPEHDREISFYSHVLSTGENPFWREDLMNNLGMPVIGLGAQTTEYAHLPLQWMPHIQVADVAASVKRALELDGHEVMHGKDKDGTSQWAVLLDPNGAAFGIIPVVPAEVISPPDGTAQPAAAESTGRISWLDLTVSNATMTRDFYRQVVGWDTQDVKMQDADECYSDFIMLDACETTAAGICNARGTNLDLPPNWMIYLPIGDLAESLRRVCQSGGKVMKEIRGDNGKFTYAIIQDPVGVWLALAQG